MTDSVFGMPSQAELAATVAEALVPPAPYVSTQIGCGEVASLMIAAKMANEKIAADESVFGRGFVEWLHTAAERGHLEHKKKGPTNFGAVWAAKNCKWVQTPIGRLPQNIAEKAGLRDRSSRFDDAESKKKGLALEAALWRRFVAVAAGHGVDPTTLRYALDGVPAKWLVPDPKTGREPFSAPKVALLGHSITTKPDGWGVTFEGADLVVNCKTTREHKERPDPPAWLQIQGEMAVTASHLGALPYGQCWQLDGDVPPQERRVDVFMVEAYPRVQAEIVAFADRAMAWVAELAAEGLTKSKKETA